MISQDRDLRTGTPVWSAYRRPDIPAVPLTSDLKTDILIIGAGISGAMMAEALSGQGYDVAIVDKRVPLSGATSASTALLQYEIDVPLIKMIKQIGRERAISAWRRSKIGLESLSAKIQELDIACDMERRSTLYLSGNILNPSQLEREGQLRTEIGLPASMISKKDVRARYGIRADAALISHDNLICNPVQLAAGFLNAAVAKGAMLYSPVELVDHDGLKFKTADGYKIKTKHVIYTTGFEIPDNIKTRKHEILSTWALSTAKIKNLPANFPMIWEASDPYIYARATQDGRIIFGGEDAEFSNAEKRDALISAKQKALEKKLARLLPDIECETEFMWAGSFGGSTNGLPSIGRIPGQKKSYAVMAYGGNGITFSRIAAEIVSADILGNKDPDAKLFAFK